MTRTRTSAGGVRLILSDPVNSLGDSRKKIALGPERLVSPKVFGMAAGRAARSESSNVSEIVKEELRGEAGEQILRQVRGIVKREIGKYATRHGLNKTIEKGA